MSSCLNIHQLFKKISPNQPPNQQAPLDCAVLVDLGRVNSRALLSCSQATQIPVVSFDSNKCGGRTSLTMLRDAKSACTAPESKDIIHCKIAMHGALWDLAFFCQPSVTVGRSVGPQAVLSFCECATTLASSPWTCAPRAVSSGPIRHSRKKTHIPNGANIGNSYPLAVSACFWL